jgi:prepilin-type N-terminal cleavage/methylation domain-containing protein
MTLRSRRAFTLVEMLISMVVLAIIGGAFTKVLVSQTRFYDREATLRSARSVARAASNVLLNDLRMVQDSGGVDSVAADGRLIRILVPYRFGLVCATNANRTTVSMLPTDQATISYSVYQGFAYRTATGRYTYVSPPNPTTSGIPTASVSPDDCTGNGTGQAQIRSVSANGRTGEILDLQNSGPSGAPMGAPVFFWQRISYSFRASNIPGYEGRLGLWRNVEGGQNEELMAPFDTATRFRFYKDGDDTSRVAPPLVPEIRGIDLVLDGMSARTTANSPTKTARVVTSVFFKNVRSF